MNSQPQDHFKIEVGVLQSSSPPINPAAEAEKIIMQQLNKLIRTKELDGRLTQDEMESCRPPVRPKLQRNRLNMEKMHRRRGDHYNRMYGMGGMGRKGMDFDDDMDEMMMRRGMMEKGRGMDREQDEQYQREQEEDRREREESEVYRIRERQLRNMERQRMQRLSVTVGSIQQDIINSTRNSVRSITQAIEEADKTSFGSKRQTEAVLEKIQTIIKNQNSRFIRKSMEGMKKKMDQRVKILEGNKGRLNDKRANIQTALAAWKEIFAPNDRIEKADFDRVIESYKKHVEVVSQRLAERYRGLLNNRKELRQALSRRFNPLKHSLIDASFRGEFERFPKYHYDPTDPNIKPITSQNFSTPYNILIEQKFLSGLFPDQWISSSVIANYCKVIGEFFCWGLVRKKINGQKDEYEPNRDECYIINDSEAIGMKNPEEFWNTRSDTQPIFSMNRKKVGVVINKNNMHWVFIGILVQEGRAILYDSMFSPGSYNEYLRNVITYAQWERRKFYPDQQQLRNFNLVESADSSIRQINGSDCGLCTIINMTKFMTGEFRRGTNIEFEYDRIPYLRFGLYLFCVYLIMCNREKKLPSLDRLVYCTFGIITEKDYRNIMDVDVKSNKE